MELDAAVSPVGHSLQRRIFEDIMGTLLNLDDQPHDPAVEAIFLEARQSAYFRRKLNGFNGSRCFERRFQARMNQAKYRRTPKSAPGYATVTEDGHLVLGLSDLFVWFHQKGMSLAAKGRVKRLLAPTLLAFSRQACSHELVHAAQEVASEELTKERRSDLPGYRRLLVLNTWRLEVQAHRASPLLAVPYLGMLAMLILCAAFYRLHSGR